MLFNVSNYSPLIYFDRISLVKPRFCSAGTILNIHVHSLYSSCYERLINTIKHDFQKLQTIFCVKKKHGLFIAFKRWIHPAIDV